ncbi:hypothetical protein SK128_018833, partial [Halocaridina rubra]
WETSSFIDTGEDDDLTLMGSRLPSASTLNSDESNLSAGVSFGSMNSTNNLINNTTDTNITSITAQLGSSVFLPCKTHHSMERQVHKFNSVFTDQSYELQISS